MGSVSDTFTKPDTTTISPQWLEDAGDFDISSNQLRCVPGGDARCTAANIFNCSSVNQYVRFTQTSTTGNGPWPMMIFRYTDSASPHYAIEFAADPPTIQGISWYLYTDAGTESTQIATSAGTSSSLSDTIGATVTGTGNSTIVSIWKGGLTDLSPESASVWDGRAADVTFTNDPASPVNTGNRIGIGGHSAVGNSILYDNFYGGDIEVAIWSVTAQTLFDGDTGSIAGLGFGHTKRTGTVKISPTDNVADGGAVTQTTTAWNNESITFTVSESTLSDGKVYVFVTNDSGASNANGYPVTLALHPKLAWNKA